ncbi:Thioredoxin-like fold domain-containing protein mrl7l, chloroplastic [Stylosanthes scabra]|uniref:Thioredoxin-like fold domain-containing protein mrl7l, chloroplastic n=1 Tax=Stylosanthes scabra TaxID=79078 RepID=A0ABU6QGA9_9FABA|nr:Thioredoxin-like fold domain-containing protein mrl7l, chloroplastic [Stylosanthes scabra]
MALPNSMTLFMSSFVSPTVVKERNLIIPNSFCGAICLSKQKQYKLGNKFLNIPKVMRVSRRIQALKSDDSDWKRWREASSDSDDEEDSPPSFDQNDPYSMSLEERLEWRRKIREVMDRKPEVQEESDPAEKKRKLEKLLNDYQLVVEEEDPDWPEDADGWGFNLGQFFDKITIKNKKKDNDDDDDDDKEEIQWQDDNYIRPIKDIKTAEWEETVYKDISPLIILVHNRYRRLPSPRCVALDAIVETELVDALQVSVFPEIIFTKAGKILYREKALRNADELSKIMAFFYYGAAKPPCLNTISDSQEDIPSVSIDNPVS